MDPIQTSSEGVSVTPPAALPVTPPAPAMPTVPRYRNDGFTVTGIVGEQNEYSEVKIDRTTWEHVITPQGAKAPILQFVRVPSVSMGNVYKFQFNVNGHDLDLISAKKPVDPTKKNGFKNVHFYVKKEDAIKFKRSGDAVNL